MTFAVRATNVYEEQSLGVYKPELNEEDGPSRGSGLTGYLGWQ